MKLTRLRITGFKSFVEPSEFLIEEGLTGVVGPNGCGKSNLVEALRWVMGESSHKNMRASGMDDVIFAGSSGRPARNHAEVVLTIDNGARTAPSVFNDADILEVSRRIDREEGSTYRINGREVRARDVQLLFADAATGARSAAMVRQGQIGEIIAAKPQARRRILEDAAGIAGLHSRRHEAELRLKAADENLTRLQDVLAEIDAQAENLKRQVRQAQRYRALAAQIRKQEGLVQAIGFTLARDQAAVADRALEAETLAVAERTRAQAEAARHQAIAAHALPPLREAEAAAAAALQRLTLAREALDGEEARARERKAELERRVGELDRDIARETRTDADAAESLERLAAEAAELERAAAEAAGSDAAARATLAVAEAALADAEAVTGALQALASDAAARKAAAERRIRDEAERVRRIRAEREGVERNLAAASGAEDLDGLVARLAAEDEATRTLAERADQAAAEARAALSARRDAENAARAPLAEADRALQRLEAEIATVRKLVAPPADRRFPPVLDRLTVAKGYEVALGAALGDDLDASDAADAPIRWSGAPGDVDPNLPEGTRALSDAVSGVPALTRRLRQVGVVARADGPALARKLRPGQRLVSPEGDLWRWDGFHAVADAPSAAARRLAERNRLAELEVSLAEAKRRAAEARATLEKEQAGVREAAASESQALEASRQARRVSDQAREALAQAERRLAERISRTAALAEAKARLDAGLAEAEAALAAAEAARSEDDDTAELEARLAQARTAVAEARSAAATARADVQTLEREADLRRRRLAAIAADRAAWQGRAARAAEVVAELTQRREATASELATLVDAPDLFRERRRIVLNEIEEAQTRRRQAADDLARAETAQAEADRAARAALDALAAVREQRAGAEARREAAHFRLQEIVRAIRESLDTTPEALRLEAGLDRDGPTPDLGSVEARLSELRADRERLGAVNLRADDELAEVEAKREGLVAEREDLTAAIQRLRQAIGSLNREGRERLLAAFEVVNGHFQRLFATLFGGGDAELRLVDAEDPLEAGLDIVARPPGKKPQTMTLLSGGEQALTATALIFAVFLTNPSPICVLDEVDAPLDDANVERYCDLLADMAQQTQTRFIVITHNPITMARMDRLFGVTMAERGVSDLVSVDLQMAEKLRDAG